jgi:SAM-dependent methyltransferase
MSKRRIIATEQRSFEEILDELPDRKKFAKVVFDRIYKIAPLPDQARVLELGAAAGEFLIAFKQLGYLPQGIEPWEEARLHAARLSKHLGIPIDIKDGVAESIPFEANVFDVVWAKSVIEHVQDVKSAFGEIYRVLKPGGVFWFNAASAMSPRQAEIRGFPAFGWYPNSLKLKILYWAKDAMPHLIGHTKTPAVNWFTPWKAREMLKRHGFQRVYDRWDLRGENEGSRRYAALLRLIRSTSFTKTLADIVVPGCSYAAVK